jgi:hypothetical protein
MDHDGGSAARHFAEENAGVLYIRDGAAAIKALQLSARRPSRPTLENALLQGSITWFRVKYRISETVIMIKL